MWDNLRPRRDHSRDNSTDVNARTSRDAVVFKHVPCMKAARFTANHTIDKIFPGGFWAETKFDGWRIQLHKTGDVVKLYSRSGLDYTSTFASIVHEIISQKLITVDTCIVDGEILTWHKDRKEAGPISSLMPVALATHDMMHNSKLVLAIRLWDVLRVNDEQLMDRPLHIRYRRLRAIVNVSDVLQVASPIKLNSKVLLHTWADMVQLLKEAVDRKEEGLVLKNPSSTYQPGSRRLGFWMKVKPDYFDKGTTEYDLLIVGAEAGKGTSIKHFLVALAEDPSHGNKPSRFRSVAHTGGMNATEYSAVRSILTGCMVKVDFSKRKDITTNNTKDVKFTRQTEGTHEYVVAKWVENSLHKSVRVIYSGRKSEGCDWVIDPRRSVIVTLKADYRFIRSSSFAMYQTLRFARMHEKGLRVHRPDLRIYGDEKPWYDCMLCGEWNHMMRASWDDTVVDTAVPDPNRFDRIAGRRNPSGQPVTKVPVVPYRTYNGSGVKRSTMLSNYVIHVQRCEPWKLKELEQIANELGARVYACDPLSGLNPIVLQEKETLIRIGTNTTSQAFATCQRLDRSVVRDTWLRDCYSRESLNPLAIPPELLPVYMLNTSTTLQKSFDSKFDIFGDSYTIPFTSQVELDHILDDQCAWDEMSQHSDGNLSNGAVRALEEDLMMQAGGEMCYPEEKPRAPRQLSWSVFADVTAILLPINPGDQYALAGSEALLLAGGATVTNSGENSLAGSITHVVVVGNPSIDLKMVYRVLQIADTNSAAARQRRQRTAKWVVVSDAWVKARSEGTQLPPPVLTHPDNDDDDDDDDGRELEDELMMQPGGEMWEPRAQRQLSWSVFADVTAILLSLNPGDQYVLALAEARLLAGGATVTTVDSSLAGRITHVVVVGNPSIDLNLINSVLPVAETNSAAARQHRQRTAKWVVVSDAWVKARSQGTQLPPPVLTQPEG